MSQQTALLKQQQNMTQQSFNTQNLLAPFLYKSLGLTPTMDAKGNITGFSQDPSQQAIQGQQTAITGELLNREQQALEGNLPVDPALTQSLDQSEAQLHESLLQNLGPGYATSTPGIQALAKFDQNKQATLEGARRGDLTMAEQLALGMQGGQNQNSGFLASASGGLAGSGAQYGQLFGQAAQGYNAPISVLDATRQEQFQANQIGVQNQQSLMTGLGSGVGSLLGIGATMGLMPAAGSAGFLLSSRDYKEDLGPIDILDNVKRLPIRRWKYKKEIGQGEDAHIGPYAEDFRDRFGVGDGKVIALVDYMGVQLAATKRIAERIDDLEDALFLKAM